MYRVTCTRNSDGFVVYSEEYGSRAAAIDNITSEMRCDLSSSETYTYKLEEKSDWREIPFKVKITLDFDV